MADQLTEAEPEYPEAALAPCPTNLRSDPCLAETVEKAWWNDVLAWGRAHHDRVARICVRSRDLGLKVPEGYCG